MRKSGLMKQVGLLLGIGLVLGMAATSEAKRPNPAEENIVIIQSASPSPWEMTVTPTSLTICVGESGTVTATISPSDPSHWFEFAPTGDIKDAEGNLIAIVDVKKGPVGEAKITAVAPGTFTLKVWGHSPASGEDFGPVSVSITMCELEITKAELYNDIIETVLSPKDASGKFTLKLIGPKKTVTLVDGKTRSGGTHNDKYNIGNLPDDTLFEKLEATWQVGDKICKTEKENKFHVLYDFLITCYNTPVETEDFFKQAKKTKITLTSGPPKWEFEIIEANEKFLGFVDINGTGKLADGRLIQKEASWGWQKKVPPAYPRYKSRIFRIVTEIKGAYHKVLEPGVSVAEGHPKIEGLDQLCIENLPGIKKTHDTGVHDRNLDLYRGIGNTEKWWGTSYVDRKVAVLK